MQRIPPDEPASVFPKDDGPQAVESGLWRIPVPLPFALRSANIYLIGDEATGWTLVDSGLGLPADEAALRAGLAQAAVALEAITTLVLTHAHPDHVGLSGLIQTASGAPVYMLAGEDRRLFGVWTADGGDMYEALAAMYAANGFTSEEVAAARKLTERTRGILRLPPPETVRLLDDGDTLRLGAHTYTAIWTPGHSDYHLCLLRDDGLFIAGDHILPAITPNIGWYPNARPDPLRDYFAALAKVRDLPARLVLPGHGRPFTGLAARVDELRRHHEERGDQILAILDSASGDLDANSVATVLFGARLRSDDDRRFALVEALAHLEYLRGEGRVARRERAGRYRYSAAAAVPNPAHETI